MPKVMRMISDDPDDPDVEFFISQLRGLRVFGPSGEQLGTLRDLVVTFDTPDYPPVHGLIVRVRKHDVFVPVADVESFAEDEVRLRRDDLPTEEYTRQPGHVIVEHDVLDRQMIDVAGIRVIRANDAEVRAVAGQLRVTGV